MYFPIIDVLKENFIAKIPSIVTKWLTDNVDPVGSAVVVDTSLSISGAAADAKITGNELNDLKSDLSSVKNQLYTTVDISSEINRGYLIDLSGGIGATVNIDNPSPNEGFGIFVIPCVVGDSIIVTCRGGSLGRAWATLDTDKKILDVANSNVQVTNLTIPAMSDGYFVVNANLSFLPITVIHKSLGVIESLETLDQKIDDGLASVANETEIVLPQRIYGVIGHELDVYKGNALMYGDIDSVARVRFIDFINAFYEDKKRFSGVPTATRSELPQFELYRDTIKERSQFKNVNLIISDPSVLSGLSRNIVIIGDSKVAGGRLPYEFKNLCTDAGMTVGDLLGSIYVSNFFVNCEGRAGWTSSDYMTSGKGGVANAFYNNGFDFSYWMNHQGYDSMDYVFINLGTNDYATISGLGSDAFVNTFIANINTMINSIHSYDADIKIIIGLAEGVCTRQYSDASSEQLRKLNTRARMLNKASIAEWDNDTNRNRNVYLCPIYMSMDMENDYLMTEQPLTAYDAQFNTGKTREVVSDTMHQNSVGYTKNAVYMFSVMTYIESLNA